MIPLGFSMLPDPSLEGDLLEVPVDAPRGVVGLIEADFDPPAD